MKNAIGSLVIIIGIALAAYIGGWVMFIGGIADVITQVRSPELSALAVAVGIAKVLFAGLSAYLIGVVFVFLGLLIRKL